MDYGLAFNSLWDDTGGVYLAFDRPKGEIVQIFNVLTQGLDVTRMVAVVEALLAKATTWKSLIAGAETAATEPEKDATGMGSAIRV